VSEATETTVDAGAPVDEAVADGAAAPPAATSTSDERLTHRGPFQRLLAQPEIGAVIGALSVWMFFWAVTRGFGTAGGAQNILDVSATLGIMAVAVAMLMIGGEFDLSSGAMTGATGILVILLVLDVGDMGGAGLNLWIALPISLVVALGVGWFNGTMVERTGLPSFIVTLATFFILRGVKLGFSKLIVGQIQVGRIDEGAGYDFWRVVFSATHNRNDHQFEARDFLYSSLALLGISLVVVAVYELNFVRRPSLNGGSLPIVGIGAVVALVGYVQLHNTDGVSANVVWSIVLGAGVIAFLIGWSLWRYEPLTDRGSLSLERAVARPLIIGAAMCIVGVISARVLNANSEDNIILLLSEQGLRAILFVGLSTGGLILLAIASFRAGFVSNLTRSVVLVITAGIVAWLAFMVQVESRSPKFRTQAFTVMMVIALLLLAWAIVNLLVLQRRRADAPADRLGTTMAAIGVVLVVVAVSIRLLFTTDEEIAAGIPPAQYSVRILWFLVATAVAMWVLRRSRFGSWTFAVGGNKIASRQVGVPAARTKTQLFMIVSGAAWLVGMLLAFRLNTIQAGTGDGEEFEYIIAAVVGGCLLTGGYGSAFGAAIGALIMAMTSVGIPSALWNSDWRFVFLGVILLLAVVGNNFIKTRAENLRGGK
jgi:ribose/xylose/arabinose/galactoside ABC-type transport system permease subunit